MQINQQGYQAYLDFIEPLRHREEPEGYTEKHHIWPRCLGGQQGINLVALTPEEHYEAHRLLCNVFESNCQAYYKMRNAFGYMLTRVGLSAEQYAEAREALVGLPMADETKDKIRDAIKAYYKANPDAQIGEANSFYGKKHSEESLELMRQAKQSENHPNWGKKRPEFAKKISQILKGHKHNEETKTKIGLASARKFENKEYYADHLASIRLSGIERNICNLCKCIATGRAFSDRELQAKR